MPFSLALSSSRPLGALLLYFQYPWEVTVPSARRFR